MLASKSWLLAGLLLATAIWGWAFVGVAAAVAVYPVVGFLFLRFAVGGTALTLVGRMRRHRAAPVGPQPGRWTVLGLGALLTAGYLAQVYGLQMGVPPATAGVLAGLVVVLVPVGEWVALRRAPRASTWMGAALVLAGTGLIAGPAPVHPGPHSALALGLLLEVAGAAAFALQLVLLSRVGQTRDPLRLAAGQLRTVAVLLVPLLPLTGGLPVPGAQTVLEVAATGLLASAVAFGIQTAAQRRLDPSTVALVLGLEPAFALSFGIWLTGQRLTEIELMGAAVLLVGVAAGASSRPLGQLTTLGSRWSDRILRVRHAS